MGAFEDSINEFNQKMSRAPRHQQRRVKKQIDSNNNNNNTFKENFSSLFPQSKTNSNTNHLLQGGNFNMGDFKSGAKNVMQGVTAVMAVIILVLVSALIIGTLLAQTVFSSLSIINTSYISSQFSLFVNALIGFLAVIGIVIAIVWLVSYIRPLFDNKTGVSSFAGN